MGGTASRLLAEAVLADTDSALLDAGYQFTRFVDDFRILVFGEQDSYEVLSFLSEQLFLSDGLSLNGGKTKVYTHQEYLEYLERELPELANDGSPTLESLSHDIYFSEDEPSPELVDRLRRIDLPQKFEELMSDDDWDFGEVKATLKALRLTKNSECLPFIMESFDELLPFAKEIVFLLDELKQAGDKIPDECSSHVLRLAQSGSAKMVPVILIWLLELFVRGIVKVSNKELSAIPTDNPIVQRQVFLAQGINENVNYFRRYKTKFDGISPFAKHAFILGQLVCPRTSMIHG